MLAACAFSEFGEGEIPISNAALVSGDVLRNSCILL